jgi:hypothetical protein
MKTIVLAVLLISSPAFAQSNAADPAALQGCPPIGQTAKGDLVYSMDCKAIKTDYTVGENKPNMPPTNMNATVIPKSGGKESPPDNTAIGQTK